VGECTWFANDEECSAEGVLIQGGCYPNPEFPLADISIKAMFDMSTIDLSCAEQTTEATCLGLESPGLVGDYLNATGATCFKVNRMELNRMRAAGWQPASCVS